MIDGFKLYIGSDPGLEPFADMPASVRKVS